MVRKGGYIFINIIGVFIGIYGIYLVFASWFGLDNKFRSKKVFRDGKNQWKQEKTIFIFLSLHTIYFCL